MLVTPSLVGPGTTEAYADVARGVLQAAPTPTGTPEPTRTPGSDGAPNPTDTPRDSSDSTGAGNSTNTGDSSESEAYPDPVNSSKYGGNSCRSQYPSSTRTTQTPWQQRRLVLDRLDSFAAGRQVTVAVVDTGVSFANPQLDKASVPPAASFVFDEDAAIAPWQDCEGHGTMVAGIIAGRPAGDSGFRGVAPSAKILSVRVAEGEKTGSARSLAAGIHYAADHGADVINVSVVTEGAYDLLGKAVRYALDKGVVVVVAAGNTGTKGNGQTWPAEYARQKGFEGLIVVGAVDEAGNVPTFSTTSVPITVAAPGQNLTGLAPLSGLATNQEGTSFAAPFVSGLAALLLEKYDHRLTPLQVKRLLESTADHPGLDLPDQRSGWGVINPYEALTQLRPDLGAAPTPAPGATIAPLTLPAAPDPLPRTIALAAGGGAVGVALLVLAGVATYRRGRVRGWRPGQAHQETPTT
ncbi:S8 family serine peptidase [Actinopolymorpha pittospori]|uniref:Type VII secretion-associated serine protease mycosin n=1 Tax=Actinopolymorpha pittospori TaxID=648752 RepID=A0A927RHF1_9ACTN|nr:type VII secretion-associated serine protease mycosin [Actinopolymorpha pittospori]